MLGLLNLMVKNNRDNQFLPQQYGIKRSDGRHS